MRDVFATVVALDATDSARGEPRRGLVSGARFTRLGLLVSCCAATALGVTSVTATGGALGTAVITAGPSLVFGSSSATTELEATATSALSRPPSTAIPPTTTAIPAHTSAAVAYRLGNPSRLFTDEAV